MQQTKLQSLRAMATHYGRAIFSNDERGVLEYYFDANGREVGNVFGEGVMIHPRPRVWDSSFEHESIALT